MGLDFRVWDCEAACQERLPRLQWGITVQKWSVPRRVVQVEFVRVASFSLPPTSIDHSSESSQPATVCINAVTQKAGGYHMILQITNLQNNGRTLSQTDCENGLISEIDNCPAGGQSDKWGWRFRYVDSRFRLGAKLSCWQLSITALIQILVGVKCWQEDALCLTKLNIIPFKSRPPQYILGLPRPLLVDLCFLVLSRLPTVSNLLR